MTVDRFSPAFEAALKANIRQRHKPTPVLLDEIVAKTIEAYEAFRWQPIETAPKDGSLILVWNASGGDDETCPLCDNWNGIDPPRGRLCLYHAHAEGLYKGEDGLNIAQWGGGFADSWEDGGSEMPDWWFRAGSDFECALNPTHWMPIEAPQTAETRHD